MNSDEYKEYVYMCIQYLTPSIVTCPGSSTTLGLKQEVETEEVHIQIASSGISFLLHSRLELVAYVTEFKKNICGINKVFQVCPSVIPCSTYTDHPV